ncbi:MAG: N-formylglutamate amidohydrolase [Rhodospirillaceae bacterium]|nr:N-formylglutamate amidohydrolase [Rhodospirillaceae bacterium]
MHDSDIPAFERIKGGRNPNFLLLCDHAGNEVPPEWGTLGLAPARLQEHIAWDIGAGAVTRRLAALLGAPALLSRYSRLFIDCNRALEKENAISEASDGVAVPANMGLGETEKARRADIAYHPYHREMAAVLDSLTDPVVIAMHSCTPVFGGIARPWHVGVLWSEDKASGARVIAALAEDEALCVGDNQPYSALEMPGYTVEEVIAPRKLRHVIIEIRQDLIAEDGGAEAWAGRLAKVFTREFSLAEAEA